MKRKFLATFLVSSELTKAICDEYNGPWIFRWFRKIGGSFKTMEVMRELLSSRIEEALLITYYNSLGVKMRMSESDVHLYSSPVQHAYKAAFIERPQPAPHSVVETLIAVEGDKDLFMAALAEQMPHCSSMLCMQKIANELWTCLTSEETILCVGDGCVLGAEGEIVFFEIPLTEARRIALLETLT